MTADIPFFLVKSVYVHKCIQIIRFLDCRLVYGKYSITASAVESWNRIQKQLKDILLKDLSPNKIKTIVSDFYLKSY